MQVRIADKQTELLEIQHQILVSEKQPRLRVEFTEVSEEISQIIFTTGESQVGSYIARMKNDGGPVTNIEYDVDLFVNVVLQVNGKERDARVALSDGSYYPQTNNAASNIPLQILFVGLKDQVSRARSELRAFLTDKQDELQARVDVIIQLTLNSSNFRGQPVEARHYYLSTLDGRPRIEQIPDHVARNSRERHKRMLKGEAQLEIESTTGEKLLKIWKKYGATGGWRRV
jgi:hypothetical protein